MLNYIGSKKRLSSWIIETIQEICPEGTIGDLFAGTGIIGKELNNLGYRVISNDAQYYSYVLCKAQLWAQPDQEEFISHVNLLNNIDHTTIGFFTQNYSNLYFSEENCIIIDSIREYLEMNRSDLGEDLYFCLLASLLVAADKVANTASVYAAYLKKIKKSAQKKLCMQPFEVTGSSENEIICGDINQATEQRHMDLVYLDPPYNGRQYGTYYHILETLARGPGECTRLKGKAKIPEGTFKSDFSSKRKCKDALRNLCENLNTHYIVLSYSNEGIMTQEDIMEIMESFGEVDVKTKPYSRYCKNSEETGVTQELLFILTLERELG